ncbi:hypothetical protein NBRC116597_21420 [Phaeobacter sp. NW0010-22]
MLLLWLMGLLVRLRLLLAVLMRLLLALLLWCRFAILALSALTVTLCLALTVLAFLLFAAGILLTLRFAQHPHVVFSVLLKILRGDTIICQLRIAPELVVFINDLLRRAAHLAFGARAVKHAVDDVATRRPAAVVFRPRTGFGRSHNIFCQPCYALPIAPFDASCVQCVPGHRLVGLGVGDERVSVNRRDTPE